MSVATLYGKAGTFGPAEGRTALSTGQSFSAVAVPGWDVEPGAANYLGVPVGGHVVLGTIPYTNRPARHTAATQSFVDFDGSTARVGLVASMGTFAPPLEADTPPVSLRRRDIEDNPLGYRLFRHYPSRPSAANVYRTGGTTTTIDTPDAERVWFGGHQPEPVTVAEMEALQAGGFTPTGATSLLRPGTNVGGADVSCLVAVDDYLIGVSFSDYDGWDLTAGRYPALLYFTLVDGWWTPDATRCRTMDQIAADAAHPEAYETLTNAFGQDYVFNPGMNEAKLLPASGLLVVAQYFARDGHASSSVAVFDPGSGRQVAWHEFGDFDRDGEDLTLAFREVKVNPTGVLGAEDFVVLPDTFAGAANAEKPMIVCRYDATTGTITERTAPFLPLEPNGQYQTATFDDDGVLWASISVYDPTDTELSALRTLGLAAWPDDSYVTAAPPGSGWVRALPPVVYGSMAETVAAPFTIDAAGDKIVTGGLFGKVCAVTPDRPVAAGAVVNSNPDFTSTIDDWTALAASCTRTWDAGAGGRCKCTPTTNGVSGVKTEMYAITAGGVLLIAGVGQFASDGHAKLQARWETAAGVLISEPSGPTYPIDSADPETVIAAAFLRPANAGKVRIDVVRTDAVLAEPFYVNWGQIIYDTCTRHTPLNLDLEGIPTNGGHLLRPVGVAGTDLWLSVQGYEAGANCPVWPCDPYDIPQFLASIDTAGMT